MADLALTPLFGFSDAERWDAFIDSSPHGHLLQCFSWGELKSLFGWRVERVALEREGEIVAAAQVLLRRTPLGPLAYIGRGPVAEPSDPPVWSALLAAVHRACRRRGVFMLRLEPNLPLSHPCPLPGFALTSEAVQPGTSVLLDLGHDLSELASAQKPKTRYNIGLAARRGVEVQLGAAEDLERLYPLMLATAERDRFAVHGQEYYRQALECLGERARLLLATCEGELLAGIIVATCARETIYLYGASSNSQRQLMPNHLLQWEAIKLARAAGCTRMPAAMWASGSSRAGFGASLSRKSWFSLPRANPCARRR